MKMVKGGSNMKIRFNAVCICLFSVIFFDISVSQTNPYTAGSFLEDFQVNENGGESNQTTPAVAMDDNGNYVVVWCDYRNGDADIFSQRYNRDGTPAGNQFKVNDDAGYSAQSNPAVAMTKDGYFWIAWEDFRNGQWQIYSQCYDQNGTSIGSNFQINNESGTQNAYSPVIKADENNFFIVIWTQENQFSGQRYDYKGIPQGKNFSIAAFNHLSKMDFSLTPNGKILIVWVDGWVNTRLWGQLCNKDGIPENNPFLITDSFHELNSPDIAVDSNNEFIVAWSFISESEEKAVEGRCYFSDGTPKKSKFEIYYTNIGIIRRLKPAIATDSDGNFIVLWENTKKGSDYPDITGQWYKNDGTLCGTQFKVNDDSTASLHYCSSIALNKSGNFVVVWNDYRNGISNSDIYAQLYRADSSKLGGNFKINNDTGSSATSTPKIAVDGQGNFMIVWQNFRDGKYDIFSQNFNGDGTALGKNFRLNDDSNRIDQSFPAVSVNRSGNFIVVWPILQNDKYSLEGRFFNGDGAPNGSSFRVDNEKNGISPAIAEGGDDYFVVVWSVNGINIFCQCFSNSGIALGDNFEVTDNWNSPCNSPSVAANAQNFIVVWDDLRNEHKHDGNWDIYGQRFSKNGTRLGTNFRLNDENDGTQTNPVVAMLNNGRFVVIWFDEKNLKTNLHGKIFSADGTPEYSLVGVNDWPGTCGAPPAIAADANGNFIIAWQDERNGHADIYSQCYDSQGNKIGVNYRVNTDKTQKYQGTPAVALRNGFIYSTWVDNRTPEHGYNIFARIDKFSTLIEETQSRKIRLFQLQQNYPNPFNPVTKISYHLRQSGGVDLQLFNVTGQRVQTLVSGFQNAGKYEVILDGTGLGSGVYYYQLRTNGESACRKCLLVK